MYHIYPESSEQVIEKFTKGENIWCLDFETVWTKLSKHWQLSGSKNNSYKIIFTNLNVIVGP